MHKYAELFKLLLFFAVVYGGFAWLVYRTRKKQREAAKLQQAQAELKQMQLRQEREERLKKLEAENAAAEERRRKIAEEHLAKMEARRSAFDAMVASIQDVPIVISDTKAPKMAASFVDDLTYSTITKRTDINKLGDFVAIDTETTGLRYTSDEIIEISAVRFRNFTPVAKFSTLLSSKKPIPENATAVNHITDEMLDGKPCFQQIASSFIDFIGTDNIVGHNLPFDLKFIVHYGADVHETKRKYFDTLALSKRIVKKVKMKWDKEIEDYVEDENSDGITDYKLETLCAYFDIMTETTHRAEGDALAAGMLFYELAKLRIIY